MNQGHKQALLDQNPRGKHLVALSPFLGHLPAEQHDVLLLDLPDGDAGLGEVPGRLPPQPLQDRQHRPGRLHQDPSHTRPTRALYQRCPQHTKVPRDGILL
jgi:hypothetical protein